MLAKASKEPFDDPAYIFEIKWDGERCIATIEGGKIVKLHSRKGNEITRQFPEIVGQPVMAQSGILDGEIVVFNAGGVPSFKKLSERYHLQDARRIGLLSKMTPANYRVFDILSVNGENVMGKPLAERKDLLSKYVPQNDVIVGLSMFTAKDGRQMFEAVTQQGHEGVMAKRLDGLYLEGKRSDAWLKIKPSKKSTCVITGYTKGNGARESLGALHISEEIRGQLVERGRVGSGLSAKSIYALLSKFKETGTTGEIIGVEPCVKITVGFFEQTEAGHYRFPVFRGEV